jgi:hypothetical protein
MPTVPIDGRRQYPKLHVEIEQVVGGKYILDKYPPATRTDYSSSSRLPEPEPEPPRTPARALWPNLP